MIELHSNEEGIQVKRKISYYKEIVVLCIVLVGILSYGYYVDYLGESQIEKNNIYQDEYNISRLDYLMNQAIERVSIRSSRSEERTYKDAIFSVAGHNRQIQLGHLLYIKLLVVFGIVTAFYRMIVYIHNKDGPKPKISPANRV